MSDVRLKAVLEGHTARVRSLAFARDGTALASAGDDGTARVWDVERGTSRTIPTGHRGPLSVAISRAGTAVATTSSREPLGLWHVASGRRLSTLARPGAGLAAFAALPDRESFAIAMEQRVLLWEAPSGAVSPLVLARFPSDQLYFVASVMFSPDGRTIATASTSVGWDRGSLTSFESVRLWDIASGRLLRTFPPTPPMGALAFSPNGALLAAGQGSQESPHEVHVWDVTSGRSLAMLSATAVGARVDAVAFSPNGKVLAIGVSGFPPRRASVLLLDLAASAGQRNEPLVTRLPLGSPATRLAISLDGNHVASGGDLNDHAVRLWSLVY